MGNKDGAYLRGLLLGFYLTREKPGKDKRSRLFTSITKNKVGVDVIKLFSSLLMKRPNKLECLYLAITFQSSLTFAGST